MKIFIYMVLLILLSHSHTYTQQAQTYFPTYPGFVWNYKVTPLDSLNNPIPSLSIFQRDSFAIKQNYQNKLANIILSKSGPQSIIDPLPYTDTTFLHFETSNGWSYLKTISELDTIPFLDSLGLVNFIRSFEGWYSYYRFSQTVNQQYTILSRDTTIIYNGTSYPIRFKFVGSRLNDQTVSVPSGNYNSKKFVITRSLNLIVHFPPLPPAEFPIIEVPDTSWIANSIWKVKEFTPSTLVDLSLIGLGSFTIPGQITELLQYIPTNVRIASDFPSEYLLEQNFPNPFNSSTIIRYHIPASIKGNRNRVTLKIFDILGQEISTLFNDELSPGTYEIFFDATNLSSGTYFYHLKMDSFIEVKKLSLLR